MKIRKFQEGGAVGAPDAQMANDVPMDAGMGQEQDPLMQIIQIAAQALQTQDCEAALAVCEAMIMLVQEAEGAAPMGEPQGEPVFKKGGKLKKNAAEGVGVSAMMKKYSNIRKKAMAEGTCRK